MFYFSENPEHSSLSKPYSIKKINVRYSIFLTFERLVFEDRWWTSFSFIYLSIYLLLWSDSLLIYCSAPSSTLSYNNFTFGYDNVQKAVQQSMAVRNIPKLDWWSIYSLSGLYTITLIFTNVYPATEKVSFNTFKVTNSIRELNVTIVIKVPVKLGDKNIWLHADGPQVRCFK